MSNTLSTRRLKFESLPSDLELLARKETSAVSEADMPAWAEIDGWQDTTHEVKFMWRNVEGENVFALHLIPRTSRNRGKEGEVGISFDEMQAARHERHTYPFAAPKLGHEATVLAMGIPLTTEVPEAA